MPRSAVSLLIAVALLAPVGAAARPFTARDLVTLDRISDSQPGPDGARVVFVRRTPDLEADRGRTDLWLLEIASGGLRRLTTDPAGDSSPRWADPTTVYFLSSRSGSSQVWKIRTDGGEAERVTDLPLDVGTFAVGTGGRLIVSLDVFPDCDSIQCTADRLQAEEERQASGRLYDHLFVRHWDQWKDGRRAHLFALSPEDPEGEEAVDLMAGMGADCPTKPFGGAEDYTVSPDGATVVFSARDAGPSEPWSTNFDLWAVPADGSAPPRNLTAANPAWDAQPVFSPDGSRLAYLAMRRPGFESDRFRVVVREGLDGPERVLTEGWDRSPGGLVFAPDGSRLYATAADVGNVSLFAIDVADGAVEKLLGEGHVRSPAPAGNGLVFGLDSLGGPVDLYFLPAAGGAPRRLTEINRERLAEVELGEYAPFSFPGWNGETVHGWIVRPAGFEPGRRYPVAFLIHGGPQGSFNNTFHYRWNPQVYAGAGYAVVTVDFHGSVGYGQAFTDAIRGDWGGKPLEDLQKGLAAALAANPWMDGERVCALGASYGGYMINWIAGNWPERFRCLVNHDGVFDMRQMYFATEELWFPEWEHGGPYWENPEGHERHNPARFVARWKTPMLVIHGANDFRVPETQGLGAFTALQRQGIPSELLYFPDESHWVLRPSNSLQWHEVVLDWLSRWTRSE